MEDLHDRDGSSSVVPDRQMNGAAGGKASRLGSHHFDRPI
jgi:hypothetical protein